MKPKMIDLDPQYEKPWADTRVALLWHCPAFSHILYSLLDNHPGNKHIAYFTDEVPIAATDGKTIFINPATFFKYTLNERVFAVAHEICHCIMNHCVMGYQFAKRGKVPYPDGKELDYNHDVMNIALDLVINDLLIESKVGQFNKDWLHDQSLGTSKDSAIDVYRKLFEEAKKNGGGKTSGMGGKRFDEHMQPGTSEGKDPATASAERNNAAAQWATEVAAGMNAARVQGKLPAALDRALTEVLEPKVNWKEHIESLFARKVGNGCYNWRTVDRRLIVRDIVAPGRMGFGADTVIVGVDTSGSIGPKEVNMFLAEVGGILEDVRPRRVLVAWCDAKLHRVDEMDEPGDIATARHKGAPGGGGTAFEPVFEYAASCGGQIDALVYLTDGYGSFPSQAPSYPVIWGSITPKGNVNYPFGDVVEIPVYK